MCKCPWKMTEQNRSRFSRFRRTCAEFDPVGRERCRLSLLHHVFSSRGVFFRRCALSAAIFSISPHWAQSFLCSFRGGLSPAFRSTHMCAGQSAGFSFSHISLSPHIVRCLRLLLYVCLPAYAPWFLSYLLVPSLVRVLFSDLLCSVFFSFLLFYLLLLCSVFTFRIPPACRLWPVGVHLDLSP